MRRAAGKIGRLVWVDLACWSMVVFSILLMVMNASRGFDITDRSFYLLWAMQPENVAGSTTHFGYITALIFDLVGQNTAYFRIAGLVIICGLGVMLAHGLSKFMRKRFPEVKGLGFQFICLVSLTGVMFHYHPWLHVPSYNWLALAGSLMVMSGLFYLSGGRDHCRLPAPEAMLCGLGGAVAFVAKPTTAAALGIIALIWIAVYHRDRKGLLFTGCAAGIAAIFLFGFAQVCFGSLSAYVNNLKSGLELSEALGGGHSLAETFFRALKQMFSFAAWWISAPFVHVFAVLALGLAVGGVLKKSIRVYARAGLTVLLSAVFVYLVYCWFGPGNGLYISTVLLSVLGCALLAAAAILGIEKFSPDLSGSGGKFRVCVLIPACLLALVSFAPPFGTISDIVRRVSESSVFVALAILMVTGLVASEKHREYPARLYALILGIMLLLTVSVAYKAPYRLPGGISEQTVEVRLLGAEGQLYVDPATAGYIKELKDTALDAGWEQGLPLIDMTGGSPGALVILGARIVGTPWLLGAYKGSDNFAGRALSLVEPDILEKAWILTAPEGKRKLSQKILQDNGIAFPDAYFMAGRVRTGHRAEVQEVWGKN